MYYLYQLCTFVWVNEQKDVLDYSEKKVSENQNVFGLCGGGASFVRQRKVRPDVSASLRPDVSTNVVKVDVSAT